jgi:NifU-like protein involved in Fe-S cluster formation
MNKIIKDHFLNPRNMGALEKPHYEAMVKSDICNDIVKMMIQTDDCGRIANIKTQVYGCGYAIAGSSIFTEAARGRRMEEVLDITEAAFAKMAKDIPSRHLSCIRLARKAYREIYEKYSTESGHGIA